MDKVFTLDDEPSADAIDIYIHRLRKHLASSSAKIMTLRGLGYILREEVPCESFCWGVVAVEPPPVRRGDP